MTFPPGTPRKGLRKTELRRTSWMKKGTKPLPKSNARQQAKRRKVYDAYLRSKVWKEKRAACIAAAGGQCEYTIPKQEREPYQPCLVPFDLRCPETTRLTAHHLTYARFGGDELPEDLQCLCASCHRRVEALKGKRGAA